MREIKFRAWQKAPSLRRPIGMYKVTDIVWYDKTPDGYTGEVFFKSYTSSEYLEDVDLMQFTGLLDKNGKEIYEGDIVKTTYHTNKLSYIGTINWVNYGFGVKRFDTTNGNNIQVIGASPLPQSTRIEVIGNIYENPELLKLREGK